MSFYSEAFFSDGLNKDEWRQGKTKKNNRRAWIKGDLADTQINELSAESGVQVRFFLDYKSSNYSEIIEKTLILEKEKTGWKIIREKSQLATQHDRRQLCPQP